MTESSDWSFEMESLLICGLNWLVPGLGFFIKGRRIHGVALFLALSVCIAIGIALHGSIVLPELDRSSDGFNWVNILSYVGQLGYGGAGLILSLLDKLGKNFWYDAAHPLSDLASLYFLVAGAMNYFATCNLYDRYYGAHAGELSAAHGKK
ncbi:hypothetical protein JXA32_15365 [Candidatus Sumerlaeota bacterium]|nr:hypothetical protein [Candidatus Sumerlaeota bacterium]